MLISSVASNVTAKMSNYMNDCDAISGGTQVVLSVLNTLSSVANIGITSTTNNTFFKEIHNVLSNVMAMKLKDVMPGAIPFNISFDNVEIVIENSYVADFNDSKNLLYGKRFGNGSSRIIWQIHFTIQFQIPQRKQTILLLLELL